MALEDESWKDITLGEGMTPVVRFDDNVLLKMDYFMPTLSFKDRGAAVLMAHCKSIGVDSVVQDSSGNAGNSVAAYGAKAGIKCEIFVPEGTKTYLYEVYEQLGRLPENMIIPVGNGTLFLGVMHALDEFMESGIIDHVPQIIALQTETCDPLLRAAEQGLDTYADVDVSPTIAEGIACLITMCGAGLKSDH